MTFHSSKRMIPQSILFLVIFGRWRWWQMILLKFNLLIRRLDSSNEAEHLAAGGRTSPISIPHLLRERRNASNSRQHSKSSENCNDCCWISQGLSPTPPLSYYFINFPNNKYTNILLILNQSGRISSPADLRYQEDLIFPGRLIEEAGSVRVGRPLHKAVKPSELQRVKEKFPDERFILHRGFKCTDLILERNASGEDALRGWLVAAYAADIEKKVCIENALDEGYERMRIVFLPFLSQLQARGWHTDRFLDGNGCRFAL